MEFKEWLKEHFDDSFDEDTKPSISAKMAWDYQQNIIDMLRAENKDGKEELKKTLERVDELENCIKDLYYLVSAISTNPGRYELYTKHIHIMNEIIVNKVSCY